jgi:hypothetical protein
MRKRIGKLVLIVCLVLIFAVTCAYGAEAETSWTEPGNSVLNIINGGTMLTLEEDFYYSENGIYHETVSTTEKLCDEPGQNLNYVDGWIYYTLDGGVIQRVSASGGESELVYRYGEEIKQMYVFPEEIQFLSEGNCYSYSMETGKVTPLSGPENIMSLIPTAYGNAYLVGTVQDYDLYAGETLVLSSVMSAYADQGYLAVCIDNENYQVELSKLFNGFDAATDLEPFEIYGPSEDIAVLADNCSAEDCPICNANAEEAGQYDLTGALDQEEEAQLTSVASGNIAATISQGQENIVKRARQLHEIEWTPLADRYAWRYNSVFSAGQTVTGIPYGQPVYCAGYVGYNVSLDQFAAAVRDNTSAFYSSYSTYNTIAPLYSCDCSSFVSYAWGLPQRHTTYTIPSVSVKVSEQSIYSVQVGDALNSSSHVVLIADVQYDAQGNLVKIVILEQTPIKTKMTAYGEGCAYSLARIQSYYLDGGYTIYRNENRDSVTYTHSCAVPIDGDYCSSCKTKAPYASVSSTVVGGKTVSLTHKDSSATIYYTTDGSTPTTNSTRYTGPIVVYGTTTIKAIGVTSQFSGSDVLTYKVTVEPVATPTATVKTGTAGNGYIERNSTVALTTETQGATLYYTTDGSTPTTSSTQYTTPITIDRDMTIKVLAVANGYTNSQIATISYKVGTAYTITASAGSNGSISPAGTTKVMQSDSKTYTIQPSSGYKVKSVLVDGVNVGAVTSYTFSNVSGNHTIKAEFQISATVPFTDVSSSNWYYEAVCYTYSNNLFNGTSTTQFSPSGTMTRGMFITVLGRMAGEDEYIGKIAVLNGSDVNIRSGPSTSTQVVGVAQKRQIVSVLDSTSDGSYTWYKIKTNGVTGYIRGDLLKVYTGQLSDLDLSKYYSGYAQWAYLTGILDGVSSGTFGGNNNITREEMALILYNYAKVYGITLPTSNQKVTFSDDGSISSTAKTAVYALQQAGIINGVGNNLYDPKGSATRAQVAKIYMEFLKTV